jgi:superfamily II DNA or RNA helicase
LTSQLPENFRPFQAEAQRLLAKGCVKAIEFSGSTYQVQVAPPSEKEPVWSFLQFNEKLRLKDCFCSCKKGEDVAACAHLAAALLAIYGSRLRPLHVRFQHSFWQAYAKAAYEELGDESSDIKQQGESVYIGQLAVLRPLSDEGRQFLERVLLERPVETEETSLKFSNLTLDEIQRWKEGRPSRKLSFELSYWNDLAHWLMLRQEDEASYEVQFAYDNEGIPNRMTIFFKDMECRLAIKRDWWPDLIQKLNTLRTPLFVHSIQESIASIRFNSSTMNFDVIPNEPDPIFKERLLSEGVTMGNWTYLSGEGFFPKEKHPLLSNRYTASEVLDRHADLVADLMTDPPLHVQPVDVVYDLSFDKEWNLHIWMTLPNFGKLDAVFGQWGYMRRAGIFHLDGVMFDQVEKTIPADKMVEFVTTHRHWLDQQAGFQMHLAGIETTLNYRLTSRNQIVLSRRAAIEDDEGEARDFGPWVYLKGQGFYPKTTSHIHLPLEEDLVIGRNQIPLFIRTNSDELEMVPGFFHSRCPVQRTGLRVELLNPETIVISPEFQLHSDFDKDQVKFFEEYSYIEGKGFCQLPPHMRLPDRFMQTVTLTKEAFPSFFSYELDQIRDSILVMDPKLRRPDSLELVIDRLEKANGGYRVLLHYQTEHGSIPFQQVWETLKNHDRFLFSPAGLIDNEEARFQWLKEIPFEDELKLSALDLIRLAAFDPPNVLQGRELLEELLEFQIRSKPDYSLLRSHLRPYQELGVDWLWFLYQHGLSGLLCDDMGLGKTHQSMALIAAARKEQTRKRPFLVVCPTSVIYHWEDKLKEFLPELNVRTFHGIGRSIDRFHEDDDILLTSYGIWRRESKKLSRISFDLAIFDEIQSAKNQKSRVHASLLEVSAQVKIGLTGTPIENRLRELKSLFDLILPGYMPQEKAFKDFFVIPIEKENSPKRKALLSRFIKPFILRRRKEEVLLDLPEKTEEVAHCELSLDQKMLYVELLNKVRGNLIHELNDSSNPVPYLHIFSVLSSLKQICNHPAAYLKNPEDYRQYQSGKWELFEELFSEALESGQKVVVFSQYLAMLDIMQLFFEERGIGYATIRGATLNRGEEVRRFNQDEDCRVFLGSLQAAGLGIDLTAASVVIHYDRWWNAAREDQATDRVHRIGQQRGVQVFKLVTKGTLEERIDAMITRKGRLMEEVVGIDDHRFMKAFDRQELIELLAFSV